MNALGFVTYVQYLYCTVPSYYVYVAEYAVGKGIEKGNGERTLESPKLCE